MTPGRTARSRGRSAGPAHRHRRTRRRRRLDAAAPGGRDRTHGPAGSPGPSRRRPRGPDRTWPTPLHVALHLAPALVDAQCRLGAQVDATTSDGANASDTTRIVAARERGSATGDVAGQEALGALLVAHGASH